MVLVAVLSLVALIGGCLGRSGSAPVQLAHRQPLTRTLTVTAPPTPRIVASGPAPGRWLMYAFSPLRTGPPQVLCGTDQVRFVASTQLSVSTARWK